MSKTEIEAAVKSWVSTSNGGDEPGLRALYADNARVLPPSAKFIEGSEAIDGMVAGYIATGVQLRYDILSIHDTPELGVTVGTYALTYPGDTPDDGGQCILVWGKQVDGAWRIVEDMFNSSRPSPVA
jgi:ketosteroid isomerase-like protein